MEDHVQNPHIRNPIEWGRDQLRLASKAVGSTAHAIHGDTRRMARPEVRRISVADLREALRKGVEDFSAYRTDVVFLCLIYPVVGLILVWMAFDYALMPLVFPLASGFALLGPVAAIGLYEMSRRRETGVQIGWGDAFGVVRSPAFGAMLALGILLTIVFLLWLAAAYAIYAATLGPAPPASLGGFLQDLFGTATGWALIVAGCGVGFLFALFVLTVSVVSFPLLLDRDMGLLPAMRLSVRTVAANPKPMALWGLIVAGFLVLGSIPALLGLAVALPVLGHATWHLYRKAIGDAEGDDLQV